MPPAAHDPLPLRVVLIGPESTGKTTLAAALAARFAAPWVPEYARTYLETKGSPLGADDVEPIARGQIAAEDEGRCRAGRLVLLDTDLVSTMVYARYYYGFCPAWIESAAKDRRAELYLLHHADVPWVADGLQREPPRSGAEMLGLFRAALEAIEARFVDVTGPWAVRMETAAQAITALRAAAVPDP